jgi:hypothetical protein
MLTTLCLQISELTQLQHPSSQSERVTEVEFIMKLDISFDQPAVDAWATVIVPVEEDDEGQAPGISKSRSHPRHRHRFCLCLSVSTDITARLCQHIIDPRR